MLAFTLVSSVFSLKRGVGDVAIPPLTTVRHDLVVDGKLVVGDGAVLEGKVEVKGAAKIGRRVRIEGPLRVNGPLKVGRGATLSGGFTAHAGAEFEGDARVEPPVPTPAILAPPAPPATPAAAPAKPETPPGVGDRKLILDDLTIDVPTQHVDELIAAFAAVGWRAHDTGRTVATDEDEESLTAVRVDISLPTRLAEVAKPPRAPAALKGVVYAAGDLHVGDDVEMDAALSASGRVVIGANSFVPGLVRAQGDVIVGANATLGDVICGGELRLAPGATVGELIEADGGIERETPVEAAPVPPPSVAATPPRAEI